MAFGTFQKLAMGSTRLNPEHSLLGDVSTGDSVPSDVGHHALKTAPIFTEDVLQAVGSAVFPQRAFYGRVVSQHVDRLPGKTGLPGVYVNTNAPFSALVCGVQGSGKSHSTAVLLESCLIKDARLGVLPAPLSGLVFHYDTAAGGGAVQPSEAAYLAALDASRGLSATPPKVVVLVLPSNLRVMQQVYAGLPGVSVEPLRFAPSDISADRLLAMMKVNSEQQMPLYMECIMSLLRSMGDGFNYSAFRKMLQEQDFDKKQKAMLNLRLSLLDSCLEGGNSSNRVGKYFNPGQLTIIDLSSPFMDASSACGFFDIILGLFVEADVSSGKVIGAVLFAVLDEAHKYLSDDGSAAKLTESLLTVVRQQRHFNARIIISTQEPTVVPDKFLGLCSFILAHRFSSPQWTKHLSQHIAVSSYGDDWSKKIVSLATGEALLFAPAGLGVREEDELGTIITGSTDSRVLPLGQGYLLVRSRLRITRDGGHSLLAVSDPSLHTRVRRAPASEVIEGAASRASVDDEATAYEYMWNPSSSTLSRAVAAPKPHVPARFKPLVDFLAQNHRQGRDSVAWGFIGQAKITNKALIPGGSIRPFLQEAEQHGIVETSGYAGSENVKLTEEYAAYFV